MKESRKNKIRWNVVQLLRFALAAVFIFSGLVKLIDPHGTEYKIEDYASAFGMSGWLLSKVALTLSVLLAATEFVLGVRMLLGIKARSTAWWMVCFLCLMTPLTFYIWISGTIVDCGCFGEALHLTNFQTTLKNVLLLLAAIYVALRSKSITRLCTGFTQWWLNIAAWAFALIFATANLRGLPMVDFRPFRIGTDLQQKMMDMNDVSMVQDLGMWNPAEGDDLAEQFLAEPGYKMLFTLPTLDKARDGVFDRMQAISDYCHRHGYPLLALTSSNEEAIAHWVRLTAADYTFCQTDQLVLKTMARSNPALILLRDATIVGKWSASELPSDEQLIEPVETNRWMQQTGGSRRSQMHLYLLIFAIVMGGAIVLDRSVWGARKLKNIKRQNKLNHKKQKTMRKKIVAGNWKMNKTLQEGVALATELKDMLAAQKPNCEVIIGTPFIHLATVSELLKDSVIAVSAENCANKESGAYTGEVSAAMVKSTGAEYVILGHSERREYYNETPEILKEKVDLALANGLKVIFCIGESLEQREANEQEAVCKAELAGSVFHLTAEQWKDIVIAYGPIWAIGTGKTATSDQAEEIHAYIRSCVAEVYGAEVADETSILYGGSCKASNAPELFAKPDIDGGLIGGASLKAPDFKGIIDAWN